MYLVVGLGNPGRKYEMTRHNAGFLVLDEIARTFGVKIDKIKFKSLYQEIRIGTEKVILLKPQTFMNLSGESVLSCMNYYSVPADRLIVVYDDKDTSFGKIRIRKKGSAGSHNGMKHIIQLSGTDEFPRVRFGIGEKTTGRLADFVLSNFDEMERAQLPDLLKTSSEAVLDIIHTGLDQAMNRYNGK